MENMSIWNAVQKTDPDYTKEVTFGRKFTAIDAHYQIMMATKQFGPIGIGWGYDAGDPIFESGAVIVPVTLWHGERSNTFGPVYGGATMFQKDKLDTDAPKKAGTDGLTKLLSQLGFNADVFLKKFDDNKYVEQLKAEKKAEDPDYAIQHNLKLDRLYYLEHSLMKPVESLFELFVPNPNELFDEMIKEYKIANGLTIKKTKVERELEKLNRVVDIKYCKGVLKNGTQCTSKVKGDAIFCGRHNK